MGKQMKFNAINADGKPSEAICFRPAQCPHKEYIAKSCAKFHYDVQPIKRSNSYWKSASFVILAVLLFGLMAWQSFAYFRVKSNLDDYVVKLNSLKYTVETLEKKEVAEVKPEKLKGTEKPVLKKSNKKSRTAIHLCGDGTSMEYSKKDEPISFWTVSYTTGSIKFDQQYIVIQKPGVYFIYAQMFFTRNKASTDPLNFFIHKYKNNSKLSIAVVPRKSCKFCSKYISRVAYLKKGDALSVRTLDKNIQFDMACAKAQFGVFMLNGI